MQRSNTAAYLARGGRCPCTTGGTSGFGWKERRVCRRPCKQQRTSKMCLGLAGAKSGLVQKWCVQEGLLEGSGIKKAGLVLQWGLG